MIHKWEPQNAGLIIANSSLSPLLSVHVTLFKLMQGPIHKALHLMRHLNNLTVNTP